MRPLLLILALFLLSTPAHAEISVCFTDPIVHLTDGRIVDLSARIESSNVQHVSYVLHIPAGASVRSITYNSPIESVTVFADGGYSATVAVTPDAPFTATMRVPSVGSDTESGSTPLTLHL